MDPRRRQRNHERPDRPLTVGQRTGGEAVVPRASGSASATCTQSGRCTATSRSDSAAARSRDMVGKLLKDIVAGGYIAVEDRTITLRRKLPLGW